MFGNLFFMHSIMIFFIFLPEAGTKNEEPRGGDGGGRQCLVTYCGFAAGDTAAPSPQVRSWTLSCRDDPRVPWNFSWIRRTRLHRDAAYRNGSCGVDASCGVSGVCTYAIEGLNLCGRTYQTRFYGICCAWCKELQNSNNFDSVNALPSLLEIEYCFGVACPTNWALSIHCVRARAMISRTRYINGVPLPGSCTGCSAGRVTGCYPLDYPFTGVCGTSSPAR